MRLNVLTVTGTMKKENGTIEMDDGHTLIIAEYQRKTDQQLWIYNQEGTGKVC